jgi:hypothetical protein
VKVAVLQAQVKNDRSKALARLHEEFGFATAKELIKAIRAAVGGRGRSAKAADVHRRKHARITSEMKEKIKAALKAGMTGGRAAAEFGISLPSVYNIKKAFGMVKSRKVPKALKPAKAKNRARAKKAEKPVSAEMLADAK